MARTLVQADPRVRARSALMMAGVMALATALVAPITANAQDAESITVGAAQDDLGTYLVGPEGKTLYYFTRDITPGVSVCSGGCLDAWPPLLVTEDRAVGGW